MNYQHTQLGWILIAVLVPAILLVVLAYFLQLGNNPVNLEAMLTINAVLLLVLLCFYRLKIRIKDNTIHLIYGIGLIHIRLRPTAITEVREVKIPFYAGWGIRFTPSGMLYNIHGNKAVAITHGPGKRTVRIGTSDPTELRAAIVDHFRVEST